jgi:hypothetical protein
MSISFCPFCGRDSLKDCGGCFFCTGCRHTVLICPVLEEEDAFTEALFNELYPEDTDESAARDMAAFRDIEGRQS